MVTGMLRLHCLLPECRSLKEKRGCVSRIIARVQNHFHAAAAEVGHLDLHQRALIGVAVVSNDQRHANSMLDQIVRQVEGLYVARIAKADMEYVHWNDED